MVIQVFINRTHYSVTLKYLFAECRWVLVALTLYLAIKGCRPPVITISSSRLRIRRTALLVLNPKKKSQIAIKIKALINKRALVTHHVSRSSHAYKHAFRLNLTLISLNMCLTLRPEFVFLTFIIMSEFSFHLLKANKITQSKLLLKKLFQC